MQVWGGHLWAAADGSPHPGLSPMSRRRRACSPVYQISWYWHDLPSALDPTSNDTKRWYLTILCPQRTETEDIEPTNKQKAPRGPLNAVWAAKELQNGNQNTGKKGSRNLRSPYAKPQGPERGIPRAVTKRRDLPRNDGLRDSTRAKASSTFRLRPAGRCGRRTPAPPRPAPRGFPHCPLWHKPSRLWLPKLSQWKTPVSLKSDSERLAAPSPPAPATKPAFLSHFLSKMKYISWIFLFYLNLLKRVQAQGTTLA